MATEVILIFDIGKTNKKVLLFDRKLQIVSEEEDKFEEIVDDDGFACDDIEKIEKWILQSTRKYLSNPAYDVKAINFCQLAEAADAFGKFIFTPIRQHQRFSFTLIRLFNIDNRACDGRDGAGWQQIAP